MLKIGTVLVPLLLIAAAFSACGGGDKKTVDLGNGNKAEISTNGKLPSGFPDDFPVYKGAKVTVSSTGTQEGITGQLVSWETGDDTSKVQDFYDKEFKDGPWKANTNGTAAGSSYWSATNEDESKVAYVSASDSGDGKTAIVAIVGDNQDVSSSGDGSDDSGDSLTSSNKTSTAEAEDGGSSDDGGDSSSGASKTSTPSPLPDEVKLDKDFPKDRVPLPSDARVTSNTSFGQGDSKTFIITFFTKDDPEKVAAYFSDEMPKHGWSDAFSSNTDGQYFVTFTGADNGSGGNDGLTVSATESTDTPGYTEVGLSLSVTTTGG